MKRILVPIALAALVLAVTLPPASAAPQAEDGQAP